VVEQHLPGGGHPTTLLEMGSLLGGRTGLLEDVDGFISRQTQPQSVLAGEARRSL
jgi:hypothetical protein